MDWLDFYKEFYFQEIDRKYSLMRSMSIPVGLATALASGLLFMANQIVEIRTLFDLGMLVMLVCAALLLFYAFYFLQRAYFNHAYQYLPTAMQIEDYRQGLNRYYQNADDEQADTGSDDLTESEKSAVVVLPGERPVLESVQAAGAERLRADKETVEYLIDLFARTSDHNALVNDERSRLLFWANAYLSGALLMIVLTGLAMVLGSMRFAL